MGAKLLQPTLTAGEVSPSLHGRVDLNRYSAGLKRCRNFIVRPYGGVENRTGFRFSAEMPAGGGNRLIPFVFSSDLSYVIVLGSGRMRFLSGGAEVSPPTTAYSAVTTYALDQYVTDGDKTWRSLVAGNVGNTPASSPSHWVEDYGLQITSPWVRDTLLDLDEPREVRYTQSADVLYLVHPKHQPRELRRTAPNAFVLQLYVAKEGPFRSLNADESNKVAASGVMGTVTLTAQKDIFTANAVGALFYLEVKDLGQIKPWVVGERGVTVGTLRRSDGKTYRAVTVPSGGDWSETGPRQPVHEDGRSWDGAGDSKTNGTQTWNVGVEWEYVDSGFGVVLITSVTDAKTAIGTVQKRLPAQVVGGVGAPGATWNLTGDGTTRTFAIAGAGYGAFAVTIDGAGVQSDPNYTPPPPIGGGGGGGDGFSFEEVP